MDEYLIIAYLEGRTTPEEEKEILRHISTSEEDRRHLADMKALHQWLQPKDPSQVEKSLKEARKSLNHAISLEERRRRARKSRKTFWFATMAACLLALVISFALGRNFIQNRNITSFHNPDSVATRLTLPDGSIVYMREGASLSYNLRPNLGKREVRLDGEAFFDVSKKAGKPFIVKTNKAEIVVHGTAFNVKALSNEKEIETILASGSVSLHDRHGKDIATLQPGQQAIFNPCDGSLELKEVHTWNILLDRYHFVMLSEVPVCEVVDIIQKTYHVRLETRDEVLKDQLITFKFQKSTALKDVVEMLSLVSGHDFTIVSDKEQ